jgi:hypothetical protein
MRKLTFRVYLECRDDDGKPVFVSTEEVLRSPRWQRQCLEKQVLWQIISRLRRHGLLDERPHLILVGGDDDAR